MTALLGNLAEAGRIRAPRRTSTPEERANPLFPARRGSLNTVRIRYCDPEKIRQAVFDHVQWIRRSHPEIEQVIWFGSWVKGTHSPGSDVDLCIVIPQSNRSPRDRIMDYLPRGFPVGLDIFVYTQDELEKLKRTHPGWYAEIRSGVEL